MCEDKEPVVSCSADGLFGKHICGALPRNPLSYGLFPIAYRLIFFIFFPSTIDVSIWRSGMSQYFRSKSSLLSINL